MAEGRRVAGREKVQAPPNPPEGTEPEELDEATSALLASLRQQQERRTQRKKLLRGYLKLLLRVVILAAAGVLLFTQVLFVGQASGNQMYPAVKDGDLLVGFRLASSCVRDDVVVYTVDGVRRVGRVVATGGDIVNITDDGSVLVNGTNQVGEILYTTDPGDQLTYPYTVPEGELFLLGDYRTHSEDSRTVGAVAQQDVTAKVIFLLRRRGL